MMDLEDDHSLLERIQHDDNPECFGILYERHKARVFRIIAKIVLDEAAAEDLTQDTFMKASLHLGRFEKRSSFQTWLCRIAVNNANAHLRKEITRRRHTHSLRSEGGNGHNGLTPRHSLFWKEENSRVTAAMETLEPHLRTSLVLTVIEGMDVAEAARIQRCTRSTMYWRVHQARKQLKRVLGYA